MITDRIFISSTKNEEAKIAVQLLTDKLIGLKKNYDFFRDIEKTSFPTTEEKKMILNKIEKCGVTILVLSSDLLNINHSLLDKNKKSETGWNYEELKSSLTWNKNKMHNSVILAYTDKFYFEYLKNPNMFSFPIINNNINNINKFRACEIDSKNYLEIISLSEFLSKPKFYLNKVDKRKVKQSNIGLYQITL